MSTACLPRREQEFLLNLELDPEQFQSLHEEGNGTLNLPTGNASLLAIK